MPVGQPYPVAGTVARLVRPGGMKCSLDSTTNFLSFLPFFSSDFSISIFFCLPSAVR